MSDDPLLQHPARPGLVFRVGVTGHRWDQLGLPVEQRGTTDAAGATGEIERALTATCDKILREIARVVNDVATQGVGYRDEPARLVIVSGLAEGADRIVARAGLDAGYQLWAVLPFGEADYLNDFDERWKPPMWSRPGAVAEFRNLKASKCLVMDGAKLDDRYVPLGRAVLHHCDILIAIWDPESPAKPGGTAQVVFAARQAEIPIVRIAPDDPGTAWLETTDPDKGKSAKLGLLEPRVRSLVAAPNARDLREKFFEEKFVAGRLGKAYGVMSTYFGDMGFFGRFITPTFPAWIKVPWQLAGSTWDEHWVPVTQRRWEERWSRKKPVDAEMRRRLSSTLAPLYAWADNLATYYANRYRSAFTVIFSLAWVAAVVAVIGFIAYVMHRENVASAATIVELGVVGIIFGLVVWGQRHHYHEKWIDYRSLAERLRHLTVVWPAGASVSFVRMAEKKDHSGHDQRSTWVGWLYRATVRELGFATDEFTAAHLESCKRLLQDHEIAEQGEYHDRASARLERIYHSLHARTNWLFFLAVVVSALHLPWLHPTVVRWFARLRVQDADLWAAGCLTVLSVFLPSRAAALHGWAGHADFFGAALRSAQIKTRLDELDRVIDAVTEPDSIKIGELAVEAARAMESELLAWHAVSRSKPLQGG